MKKRQAKKLLRRIESWYGGPCPVNAVQSAAIDRLKPRLGLTAMDDLDDGDANQVLLRRSKIRRRAIRRACYRKGNAVKAREFRP